MARCNALGAGLRSGSQGQGCGIPGAQRFLSGDQPDLSSAFSCLAQVGTIGDVDERPVEALLAATGAGGTGSDGCNAGFLRDDAVLVVTIITDEEDDKSDGEPEGWKSALLAAKNGNEDAIVVLGLIADNHVEGGLAGGPCDGVSGAESPRLQRFVESFGLGSLGSVCASDYSGFFAQAVATIDAACEVFAPPLY